MRSDSFLSRTRETFYANPRPNRSWADMYASVGCHVRRRSGQLRALTRSGERCGGFAGEGGGGGFAAGGFLEEEEGGEGFAGDVVSAKDGHHVVSQELDGGRPPLLQVGDDEIEGGEGGFVGVAVDEEGPADVGEEAAGLVVIAEAGGDAAFDPGEADAVESAALGGCQDAEVWQEVGGLGVAAHLGEVVDEVVADAEDEAGIALGIDPAVGFLQDLDDGFRFALLYQHGRLRDEAPTGEMRIPVLGLTAQIEGHGLVEQLERFREAPLRHAEGGLQIQKDRLVAQRISGAPGPRLPPGVRHLEAPLGSGKNALHPLGVAEPGPGEALELVDPLFLERLTCWEQVGYVDGQVGEMEGFGGLLRCGQAALADQQLAQAPATYRRLT
jgi:hypothetical protein